MDKSERLKTLGGPSHRGIYILLGVLLPGVLNQVLTLNIREKSLCASSWEGVKNYFILFCLALFYFVLFFRECPVYYWKGVGEKDMHMRTICGSDLGLWGWTELFKGL